MRCFSRRVCFLEVCHDRWSCKCVSLSLFFVCLFVSFFLFFSHCRFHHSMLQPSLQPSLWMKEKKLSLSLFTTNGVKVLPGSKPLHWVVSINLNIVTAELWCVSHPNILTNPQFHQVSSGTWAEALQVNCLFVFKVVWLFNNLSVI